MNDEKTTFTQRIARILDSLEAELKGREAAEELSGRGVNVALALLACEAVRNYVQGNKAQAAEDFDTLVEEILTRMGHPRRGVH